jgi:hypothetical protein
VSDDAATSEALEQCFARLGSSVAIGERLGVASSTVRTWRHRGRVVPKYAASVRALANAPGKPAVPLDPLPPRHRLRGVSTMVDAEGNTRVQWVKTAAEHEDREAVLRRLLTELPAEVPVRVGCIEAPKAALDSDLVAVVCIGDAHVGAFAWARESGDDYDLEIAESLMATAIADLVERGPAAEVGLLVNLGDFFTADGVGGTTTAGTPQSTDSRYPKVLEAGMRMLVDAVDAMLRKHARVIVDCQAGNHDAHTAVLLAIGLKAHFRNEPRVTIPVQPAKRHYHQFGKVLVGTTHGDGAKIDGLPALMAAEAPDMWGTTRHRYFYLGHFHHCSRKDFPGCTVETFRTLAGRDAWHAGAGYLSPRDMQRITIHVEYGEVSREVANVDYLRSRMARAG